MRIVLCDDDELELAAIRKTATDTGFDVVDTARHAVELLQLASLHHPDAALIRNEVYGVSGVEVTEDLRNLERSVEVILLTSDPSLEPHGLSAGAFAVVRRGDVEGLERALGALSEWLGGGERRSRIDRRSGEERRREQDWSKVFSERRSGEDRRKGPRRKSDRTRAASPPPGVSPNGSR
jgi:DNA-binding NarL/FixJ family response regulator